MMEEIVVPLGLFAMIAAIVIGPGYFRARNREKMLETLRVAYEKGQPVPPELIEAINTDPRNLPKTPRERAEKDLRTGVVLLAVALAFVALAWGVSFEERDAYYPMVGVAAFPGFIGIAMITFGLLGRRKKETL